VQDADIIDGNTFLDEVEVDLDMLHTLVLNGVGGEVDSADVVGVDESALGQRSMELLEELPEPTSFNHGAQTGDDVLALGGLGDKVVAEKYNVARGGPTCIRATRPVRVGADRHLGGGGGATQAKAEVQGASLIAQDALHRSEVRLPGNMHMKSNLLNGVGDVRAGKCQVLESPDEASELSRISNRRPRSGRDLGLCVHGC
jgi:hypothetical protein